MSRPKTEAATYAPFLARLPQDVMQVLRDKAQRSGAPLNGELVRALRRGLRMPALPLPDDTVIFPIDFVP